MVVVPNKNDVLFGRGHAINAHPGNRHFRSIIDEHKPHYNEHLTRKKKRELVGGILDKVNRLLSGPRFLEEVKDVADGEKCNVGGDDESCVHSRILAKKWAVVDREKIVSKILHRLREKIAIDDRPKFIEQGGGELHGIDESDSGIEQRPAAILKNGLVERYDERSTSQPTAASALAERTHSSKKSTALTSTSSIISLREWIKRAMEASDHSFPENDPLASSCCPDGNDTAEKIRRALVLSSESYLKAALTIGLSLSDQWCDGAGKKHGGNRLPLPPPGTDWADRVVVHQSNELQIIDDYAADLQPLPLFSETPNSDPDKLRGMLYSLFSDHALLDEGESTSVSNEAKTIPLHVVTRAEFLHSPNDELVLQKSEMQRIYNLGLVFYEIFSGGESPPEFNAHTDAAESMDKGGVENGEVDIEPLPFNLIGALDLERDLNIFDDINDVGNLFQDSDDSRLPLHTTEKNLMPKKKGSNPSSCSMLNSISTEPLRMMGVPSSLCDLIGNMLDIINGDLSKDEAYRTMSDVRSDLHLMLNKPDRFLYDMDVEKLAVTGLQLNDAVFGREMDLTALKDSYRRSISGKIEFAVIVGPSGIGKTILANRLGSFASADGALFLTGKFDQLQQMTPFSALASAFNDFFNQMAREGRESHLQLVVTNLKAALGEEAWPLVKVIPNLGVILGEVADQYELQECANAPARIQYLLCQFVDVISCSSRAPIVLFLDDLQWSDQASLSAIKQLLLSLSSKRQFFFLGSCREEGLVDEHPFGSMIASICRFGVRTTIVKLDCLDKDTTNSLVSDLLCLSPRLTRTLSDVLYHKTQGNPFFFSRLIISLCRDGLVQLSLRRRRWEWDEEKIQSVKIPDDVAVFLYSTIERLPAEVQSALCTLSCFGARSDCVLIEALEANINIPLIEPLQVAVAEGIVDLVDGRYSFGHDKLQEAAYNLIRNEDRKFHHCKYGTALVQHALESVDDVMLFTAVSQINLGGPSAIHDAEQALQMASLNLTAGFEAMEMSDFSSAFTFFDHGINFLRTRHWQEHYDLSLQLYEAACKCALVNGDVHNLKLISDQIFTFAKRFEDKLNAMFYNVTALAYSSKLPESIEMTLSVLKQLGIELPVSTESDIMTKLEPIKSILQGFTDQELIKYKVMSDPSMIMAMKFLARLETSLYHIRPAEVPIITLKMIQLSLNHGMSPVSPIGLTYFGHLVASCGNIDEGCRYVNIARKLQDRIGSKDFAGEVISSSSQLVGFIKPLQISVELYSEGFTIAMAAGDMQGAMLNLMFYCGYGFWTSVKLTVCKERFAQACKLMDQHGHFNFLAHIIPQEKNIHLLMGNADGREGILLSNDTIAKVGELWKNALHHGSISFNFQKMYIHLMFREYDDMKSFAEKVFSSMDSRNWILLLSHAFRSFISGIVAFWVYRQTNDPIWFTRGQDAKAAMMKWAESSNHNFQHKVYLLEAEEAFCNNRTERAQFLYEQAVSMARNHRFANDEALSNELAGYFFLANESKVTALQYFQKAHEKYHDWGAYAKCSALFEFVQMALGSACVVTESVSPRNTNVAIDDENLRKRVL